MNNLSAEANAPAQCNELDSPKQAAPMPCKACNGTGVDLEIPFVDCDVCTPLPACTYCGDSGDVHRADGEWLGECDCISATLARATKKAGLYDKMMEKCIDLEGDNEALRQSLQTLVHISDATDWEVHTCGEIARARDLLSGMGADLSHLEGRAGAKKVFEILISTESGCNAAEGEYSVSLVRMIDSWLDEDDMGLILECVENEIADLVLPEEGQTTFIVYESGERDDVFWNKYYLLKPVAPAELAKKEQHCGT